MSQLTEPRCQLAAPWMSALQITMALEVVDQNIPVTPLRAGMGNVGRHGVKPSVI
jgi:hypothetical protein